MPLVSMGVKKMMLEKGPKKRQSIRASKDPGKSHLERPKKTGWPTYRVPCQGGGRQQWFK